MRTSRVGKLSVIGGVTLACVALGVACALQSPDTISGPRPSAPKQIMPGQNSVYFEFQVEQPVSPVHGNPTPRYPDMLRSANVEGEVLAQFVVDERGVVDMGTLKVLKSTHELFTTSVTMALPQMSFKPALVGGHAVKQLVQMPFQFNLARNGTAAPAALTVIRGIAPATTRVRSARDTAIRQTPSSEVRLPDTHVTVGPEKVPQPMTSPTRPANVDPSYFEFQVTKPAAPQVGNFAPRYPDMLRSTHAEGEVVAQFVVGADGRVDVGTFKVLKETHPLFSESVKASLPMLVFSPAMVNGTAVRQLLQMPFTFSLSKP